MAHIWTFVILGPHMATRGKRSFFSQNIAVLGVSHGIRGGGGGLQIIGTGALESGLGGGLALQKMF